MAKCCDITSGMLNEIITIERNTPATDGEGGFTDSWSADPTGGVWAKVKASAGGERVFGQRVQPGNRYTFIIRFRDDGNGAPYYTIGDRVVYNGKTMGITGCVDVEGRRRYIEIKAEENKAS